MEDIYNQCLFIVQNIVKILPNAAKKEQIAYARNNVAISILKNNIVIGKLSKETQQILSARSTEVKLSFDTIIKNSIEHPEIKLCDYKNLNKYIDSAEHILKKDDKNIIYFKKNNKLYQFVIKTTESRKENFITTFHFASENQLKKDLKRYQKIR